MRRGTATGDAVHSGFTLLEIVLALALFLGAITVLAQIAWNGQRAAIQARLRTEAAFRCESKLAEVLSGAQPFQTQERIAFEDDPNWTWSTITAAGQYPELIHLKVIVEHRAENPAANAEFSLDRWIRDPALFTQAAAEQTSSSVDTTTRQMVAPSQATGSSGGSR